MVTGSVRFGAVLRSFRLAAGLSQDELAARAGLSTRAVSELERGRVTRPRSSSVRLLAQALGLEGADLRRFERAGFEPDGATGEPDGATGEPDIGRAAGGGLLSRPVPAQVPAAVAAFTGRAAELSTLDGLGSDTAGSVVAISAVSGMAGVGKTALAVHWAHRVRDRFPDGQLYVNLRGYDPRRPVPPADALAGFLEALGVRGAELPLDADGRAARFRTEIAGRRMLVVLDNASSAEQVRPLLPGTPTCTVLVTSRDSLAGLVAVDGARRLDLDLLPLPDAVALLRRLIGERVGAEPAATDRLAEQCGRLPLALRIAAELANTRPRGKLADLVDEFADEQRRLRLLDTGGDPHSAVRAVLSWSYSALPDDAAAAFRRLGLHPASDFDRYAVAALAGVGIGDADRAIDTLVRAHLLHRSGPGRYGLHDLLRAYAADLARTDEAEQIRQAALTRLFDGYLATAGAAADTLFPAERHRRPPIEPTGRQGAAVTTPAAARAWLDAERPALVAVAAYTADGGWPTHATRLSAVLYRYLTGGHHSEAVAIHEAAHRAALTVEDRGAQALALTGLGSVQLFTGRYGPAAEYYRRARDLYRSVRDPGGEASTLTNLGILHARQGRHAEAVEHHRQALERYRDAEDAPGQAGALMNIAGVDWMRGRHADAAEGFQRALAFFRECGDQAGEALARSNLGTAFWSLGRFDDAAEHHQQALDLFEKVGDKVGAARALSNIGAAHAGLHQFRLAADHFRRALPLLRDRDDRYGEAVALNGLGEAQLGADQPTQAVASHAAALALCTGTGDRQEQARAHTGLGHAHRASGALEDARVHWVRAVSLYAALGSPAADNVRALLAALDGTDPDGTDPDHTRPDGDS